MIALREKGLMNSQLLCGERQKKKELTGNLNNLIFFFAERLTLWKKSDSSACPSSVLQHMADSEDPL